MRPAASHREQRLLPLIQSHPTKEKPFCSSSGRRRSFTQATPKANGYPPLSFMLFKCFATAVVYLLYIYKACQISKWRHSRVSSGDLTKQTALYSNKSFQLTKLADPTLVWGEMHGPEHARSRLRAQTMTSSWMCFINIAVLQESFQKKKIIRGTTTEWQFYIQSTARILGCPIFSLPN